MYQMKKGGSSKSPKQQAAIAMSMKAAGKKPKMAKGGSFPDLTGDGEVTQADILKGRGVIKKHGGSTKMKMGGSAKDKMGKQSRVDKNFGETTFPAPQLKKGGSVKMKMGGSVKSKKK